MTRISVLTIAAGRADHLANVIHGLNAQDVPPSEFVIAYMQDAPYDDLPETAFPVRQVPVAGGTGALAEARNLAATTAIGDVLIFLDVDCIPHPGLVGEYAASIGNAPGLHMGEVMYLPRGATSAGVDFARFDEVAEKHSDRGAAPKSGRAVCDDYRCFWSLNFAISRTTGRRPGGSTSAIPAMAARIRILAAQWTSAACRSGG